jgi:hypothetical protein
MLEGHDMSKGKGKVKVVIIDFETEGSEKVSQKWFRLCHADLVW